MSGHESDGIVGGEGRRELEVVKGRMVERVPWNRAGVGVIATWGEGGELWISSNSEDGWDEGGSTGHRNWHDAVRGSVSQRRRWT